MSEAAETGPVRISGAAEFLARAVELVGRCRLEICLLSRELDRRVYSDEAFIEPLKRFLLSHQRARLRGLVHSPQAAMRGTHRLVELARQLSSRVEFRELPEDQKHRAEESLIGDEHCLLLKPDYSSLEARWYAHAPLDARLQKRGFQESWEQSVPAREFSELKI